MSTSNSKVITSSCMQALLSVVLISPSFPIPRFPYLLQGNQARISWTEHLPNKESPDQMFAFESRKTYDFLNWVVPQHWCILHLQFSTPVRWNTVLQSLVKFNPRERNWRRDKIACLLGGCFNKIKDSLHCRKVSTAVSSFLQTAPYRKTSNQSFCWHSTK